MINEVYQEIKDLDAKDFCPISDAFCKFTEESGEWIREINKTTGRKIRKETPEQIHENILEEAADTLQNYLLVCSRFNITIGDLMEKVREKNIKWESQIEERQRQAAITLIENGKTKIYQDGKLLGSQG